MTPCKYFAQGNCRFGDRYRDSHELNPTAQNSFVASTLAVSAIETPNIDPTTHPLNIGDRRKPTQNCTYFLKGLCNKGGTCRYAHPSGLHSLQPPLQSTVHLDPTAAKHEEYSSQASPDSRAKIPCRYFFKNGGCTNDPCPYRHAEDGQQTEGTNDEGFEIDEYRDQEPDDDFTRDIAGASVSFDEFGHVLKISLPTDFSVALITGLESGTTCEAVVRILRDLGFHLNIDSVRMLKRPGSPQMEATVKMENPLFAKELSSKLSNQRSNISATPVSINSKGISCRKAYISWHKATRRAWLNFGNGEIADHVAQKFKQGKYKCLGQTVKSTMAKKSLSRGYSHNPVAWTITLSDVPRDASSEDIKASIISIDKPRHVEMGAISYRAADAEVSVEVRSLLEEHGPLENFCMATPSKGKRVKATAWFRDEANARSACSLYNNKPLDILNGGRLTITLLQSVKIKVFTNVYLALKSLIEKENKTWKEQHLQFHVYTDTMKRFTTLKIEGENTKDVANARKILNTISSGVILTSDKEEALWHSDFSSNGATYGKLKLIEEALHVVIIRDKSKRQLQFYGPHEKLQETSNRVIDIIGESSSTSYQIDLGPKQFSWVMHGGFRNIEQVLGKNIAVFNVISKKIIINGTRSQYETALALMDGRRVVEARSLSDSASGIQDCPICFSEAETPIKTSCNHLYCLECFEGLCKSAGSTDKDGFHIKCQGDGGACSTIFNLKELKDHLSSSVFEVVLGSSFEEYIQRHPDAFRYCPTPDCGYIYRCNTNPKSVVMHTCPNCFEPICTSCHARHGDYTCAEYKDIASGGVEALKKLKRELNIKDCPKCTTPMEKTEGCNHMTCGGCKAHICWVCMKVFETSDPCYSHMTKEHGGIGLGLERYMD
ncbi:hypothetical protein F5884DRAFT_830433 [Xylogone sp. PMI_703]|nr:hypothetical protein F5884DRAFT_830433 [Xylogone sp. PMI_703]